MTKLKNSNYDNSKTQIVTKLKNQNSYNSETQIVTKLNFLICDKTQNSNCDKTQIVTTTDEISQGSFLRSRDVFLSSNSGAPLKITSFLSPQKTLVFSTLKKTEIFWGIKKLVILRRAPVKKVALYM